MGLKEEVIEMKKEVEEVKEQSLAMELLSDYKIANRRQYIIILVILGMWFATIGYLVYVLNDIGVEETTLNDRLKRGWNLEQALTISTKGTQKKVFK